MSEVRTDGVGVAGGTGGVDGVGTPTPLTPWDLVSQACDTYRSVVPGSTGKTYARALLVFFRWCRDQGWVPSALPQDVLLQYLPVGGPIGTRMVSAAIKSFHSIGFGSKLGLSLVDYPSITVPRKARVAAATKSATRVPAPAPVGLPLPVQWAPTNVSPSSSSPAPLPGTPMAYPHGTDTRRAGAAASNVLNFLPPGGRFRLHKRGTGELAGKRMTLPSVYSSVDLGGYADVEEFISRQIVPDHGPGRGDRPVVYEVERLDDYGRPVTPKHEFTFEAPQAKALESEKEDKSPLSVIGKRVMDTYLNERDSLLTLMRNGGGNGGNENTSLNLMVRDRLDRMERDLQHRFDDAKKAEAVPLSTFPDPNAGAGAFGAIGSVASIAERAIDRMQTPLQAPAAPPVDHVGMMRTSWGMAGELIDKTMGAMKASQPLPPVGPSAESGMIQFLRDEMNAQRQEMVTLRHHMMESSSLDHQMESMQKLLAMGQQLTGGAPQSGPASVAEAIQGIFHSPALVKFAEAMSNMKEVSPSIQGKKAEPKRIAASVPEPIRQAIFGIRDSKNEAEIVSGIEALLAGLAGAGGNWAKLSKDIVATFRKLEMEEELLPFVMQIFTVLRYGPILRAKPGLATRIAKALANNYEDISLRYFGAKKKLLGVQEEIEEEEKDEKKEASNGNGNGHVIGAVEVEPVEPVEPEEKTPVATPEKVVIDPNDVETFTQEELEEGVEVVE